MILDYGSVMVHVMTPKSRLFYNVEGKWKQPQPMMIISSSLSGTGGTVMTTAIPLDLSHLLVPNTATIASNTLQQQQQRIRDGDVYDYDSIVSSDNTDTDLDTYQDEGKEEEELDPFWS